jgi:hypothetical protein
VSKVIGSEFDKAFKNIMTDLAAGDVSLIDDDGEEVALDDLKVFFEYCGGGEMGLDFRCNAQKNGKLVIYAKEDIPVDASLSLVSGEITFGGTIRF